MGSTLIERLAVAPAVGEEYRPWALSPDGKHLAFQYYRDGDWQVYVMDASGGGAHRVGDLDDACGCPQFSPDGRFLYFARDDRGSECYDYYRWHIADGILENLLPDTPDLAPLPDFDLSPDGRHLALTAAVDDGYAVAVMAAAVNPRAADLRLLSRHPYTESSPRWSPDGRRLAVAAGTEGQHVATFILEAGDGESVAIGGSPEFLASDPAWSPDGRFVAFSGGADDHPGIGLYDVAGGGVTWVWHGDGDAHTPAWSPDGNALVFLVDHEAETTLRLVRLKTRECRDLSLGAGNHYYPLFTPDGGAVVCGLSAPHHPNGLWRVDLATGQGTRLTDDLPDDLRETRFRSGGHITYRSWDHLAEVPALLVEPEQPNGGGVVMVHGGPTWHHSNEWDPLRQAFVAAGLTVIHPNYRGSDGYGRRWQLANRWLMGQGEVLDVAGAHEELVRRGCDPQRIAVTGRSWGGFHTMAAVTQFPELWAAGVAGVPFFDFIDAASDTSIRADLRWWDLQNTGDPAKDRAKLAYYSPINHLDRVRAPLLLLGGKLDPRCPPRQIADVAARLRERGLRCDTVVYEDEGHAISGFENRLDYDRRTVEFILEYTGG